MYAIRSYYACQDQFCEGLLVLAGRNKNKIVETLRHYKIEITKIRATIGPTITLYEIVPAPGVRISKIKNLEDDIAFVITSYSIHYTKLYEIIKEKLQTLYSNFVLF